MTGSAPRPAQQYGTRTKARKRALDILFEADVRQLDIKATLSERTCDADPPVRAFTGELVLGVARHQLAIDQRIAESLVRDWTLERMPRVDRILCQIAVYEMDYSDTDPKVAIAEAVLLAGDLSTDGSPNFVNGVLGQALRLKSSGFTKSGSEKLSAREHD